MNQLVIAVVQEGGPLSDVAQTFGVDWPHLLSQIVSFSIVCAVLYRWAYQPILQILAARREQIAQGLADAEQIKRELARIEVERREVLAKADAEGRQLVEDARAAAARIHTVETQRAAAAAEQILLKAREGAEREHARMLADLKRHIGRLVIQTSAAVTGKILTPADHDRLAEETARYVAS